MEHTERLLKAFKLEKPDRPPILGGWLAAPEYVQVLTGCSADDYWADSIRWSLAAEKILGSDGLIDIFRPIHRGEFRCVDGQVLEDRAAFSLDDVLAWIDSLPDADTLIHNYVLAETAIHPRKMGDLSLHIDEDTAYARYAGGLAERQLLCGDMAWCPADWRITPKALWYHEFGYENALMLPAIDRDAWRKLFLLSAMQARQRAILRARATREGEILPALFTGEDLCSQRGPMISPKFLAEEYFPIINEVLEPLLAAGVRVVWHCDGDYRPLLDDVLACGVAGLQGFQQECGMDIEWIVERTTRDGEPLLIFGPMSVTQTLPYGTPDDVRAEVARAMHICRDKASLVLFPSNTLTPDIPLANITAFWASVLESCWD